MENNTSKSFLRDPQNIIAIAVSLISICALFVSIKQTQIMSEQRALMYEQAQAAVWPRLEIGISKGHSKKDYSVNLFNFMIVNGGVGPAIITDTRVTYDKKTIRYWGDLFEAFNLPKDTPLFYANVSLNNSVIKIGESYAFLSLTENLPVAQGFYDNREKVTVEIWYESIYGDQWKLTYNNKESKIEEVHSQFSLPEEEQFKD